MQKLFNFRSNTKTGSPFLYVRLPTHNTYIVPFYPIVKSVHSSTWCAASFGIGMRNPTKSAIFLTMEILHPGPWFRTQSSYYLKPNLSALFQWRTSCAARSVVQRPRFIFMGNQPFFSNGESNGKSRSSWCAACTISHTSLPRSTMEMPMENLLIGKGYANE